MPLKKIILLNLKNWDIISLYNENKDPSFGSIGVSELHLKFLEDSVFEVIRSTRSLVTGMKLISTEKTWNINDKINFIVKEVYNFLVRNIIGRKLNFKMRPIQKIELNNFTNYSING